MKLFALPPIKPRYYVLAALGLLFVLVAVVSWVTIISPTWRHRFDAKTTRPGVPANDPARGMIYDGLNPGKIGGPCEGQFELQSDPSSCTHGPDPAPDGVDVRKTQVHLPSLVQDAYAAPSFTCTGDGTSGSRVQPVYLEYASKPSTFNANRETLLTAIKRMDDDLNQSSKKPVVICIYGSCMTQAAPLQSSTCCREIQIYMI